MKAFPLALALFLTVGAVRADRPSPAAAPFVVVALMPGTTLGDWRDGNAPNLHALMASSAVGLINTRTARMANDHLREPQAAAVMTLASGGRAAAVVAATQFYPPESPTRFGPTAGQLYERRMGMPPPGQHVWVDPDWPRVLRANSRLGYALRLGNLADTLATHGIEVTAVEASTTGQSDWAALFATTGSGTVRVSTNDAMMSARSGCWIVDLGGDMATAERRLAGLADVVRLRHGRLLVLSPFVNDNAYAGQDRLAPVLLWGAGIPAGLLRSPSTHRAGLAANVDIAATVADAFGVTMPPAPTGDRPVTVQPAVDAVAILEAIRAQSLDQRRGQAVLPVVAVLLGVALAAMLWRTISGQRGAEWLATVGPAAVVALAASWSTLSLAVIAPVLLLLGLLAARAGRAQLFVLGACAALGLLLIVDAALGGPWMQRSLLGYSAIEGARYYGMGNEAMGALAGALAVALGCTSGHRPGAMLIALDEHAASGRQRYATIAAILVVVMVTGWPSMGAKAGGVIVVASMGAIGLALAGGACIGAGRVVAAVGAAMVLLLGMAAVDASRVPGAQSHLGGAWTLIAHGGGSQALDIVRRKLAVEMGLLVHSAWAVPVWAGLACAAALRRKAPDHVSTRTLLDTGLAGALLCLLFNDAGAVAGALCLALVCSMAYVNPPCGRKDGIHPTLPATTDPIVGLAPVIICP
ncbi:MAG: hypothetical protein ACLQVD_06520 [Capsulimonadaceae bacterium]